MLSRKADPTTMEAMRARFGASYSFREICTALGFSESKAPTIRILVVYGLASRKTESHVRKALGLGILRERPGKIGIGRVPVSFRKRKEALGVSWEEVVEEGLRSLECMKGR